MKYAQHVMTAMIISAVLFHPSFSTTVMAEDYQLEPITVTAQKKEENVQEIPMSVSVFSALQLEDANIENTFDLTRLSPNILMKDNHAEHVIVIRGISSFTTSIFSPAGYYVDEVSYPLHYMHNAELFDVERVEILRGPQGTLYGRNSESGVRYYKHDYLNDLDFWDDSTDKQASTLSYEDRQYSQELRFSPPGNSGPVEWLAGVYGFKEETDIDYMYDMVSAGVVYRNPVTNIETSGYAVFGQGT